MTDFSFQLYSARNFPPLDYVFELLARHGYKSVEGYGGLYDKADEIKGLLAKNDLTMPTGHFGLDQLRDKTTAVKTAQTLGIKTLFCPAVPRPLWEQPEDDWKALAAELAALGEFYKGEGFGFGWHNHHFEFWPTAGGTLPMNIILDGAPDIGWEMDVAWVVRGEGDVNAWLDAYGARIVAVHVKDIAPKGEAEDEDGWADVGHGTMDWSALLPLIREKTQTQHFVMEHDNPSDIERFASRSIASAKTY